MTEHRSLEALVGSQFGGRAEAYLASAVHARGPDLDAIAGLVEGQPDARVLDLGCGGGHVTFKVAPHVREVVAYDLSREMLAVVARAAADRGLGNVATMQGVVERLPFDEAGFDMVMSRFSAHHWRDVDGALREAARVLVPGGVLVIVDTVSPGTPLLDTWFQALELLRDPSHARNYSRAEWQASIARAGLIAGAASQHRLHLDFTSWVERMATPKVQVDAIRALHAAMPDEVRRRFEVTDDGSFSIDVAMFEAVKPGG